MRKSKNALWLEDPQRGVVVGNSRRLTIALLERDEDINEVRRFYQSELKAIDLRENTKVMLQQCCVITGDRDWEPDSPLDLVSDTYKTSCALLKIPARLNRPESVLRKPLRNLISRINYESVLECVIWSSDSSRDILKIREMCAHIRTLARSCRDRLFVDIWVHTPCSDGLHQLIPLAEKDSLGIKVNIDLPEGLDGQVHKQSNETRFIRLITEKNIPLCIQTKITAKNVGEMYEIALHYADLTNGMASIELPLWSPLSQKKSGKTLEEVAPIKDYCRNLLNIYTSHLVTDDLIAPIKELRQRLAGIITGPHCGSFAQNQIFVDMKGNIHPCEICHRISRSIEKAESSNRAVDMPVDCRSCQYKFFCGLPCSVVQKSLNEQPVRDAAEYAFGAFCLPRKMLLETMIKDIVDERTFIGHEEDLAAIT